MEKEEWINEVLNSTRGLKKVSPPESLLHNIRKQAEDERVTESKTAWLVAASVIFIIALNVRVYFKDDAQQQTPSVQEIDNPFSGNNQLY